MPRVRGRLGLVAVVVAAGACQGFRAVAPDGGAAQDLSPGDRGGPARDARPADHEAGTLPRDGSPGDGTPATATCSPVPLACLDPSSVSVIEVPTEVGQLDVAFAQATSGQTVQVRGLKLGAGWAIPVGVTLRGCAGAQIQGEVRFRGTSGTIEGFQVSGGIVANQTGSFRVRRNRFVAGTDPGAWAVSARSAEALVPAVVTLTVEGNWFDTRTRGVEGLTRYDTLTHQVTLTVQNNVFHRVEQPVSLSEGGMVGKIKASLRHNTLHAFKRGVTLSDLSETTVIVGNLLLDGETGIVSDSPYELRYALAFGVTTLHTGAPASGQFDVADPRLTNPSGGELEPLAGSPAIDAVPAAELDLKEDYRGCTRPASASSPARGDIGAFEVQRVASGG